MSAVQRIPPLPPPPLLPSPGGCTSIDPAGAPRCEVELNLTARLKSARTHFRTRDSRTRDVNEWE